MKFLSIAAVAATFAAPANATIVASLTERGTDLVLSYSGSIDSTEAVFDESYSQTTASFNLDPRRGWFDLSIGDVVTAYRIGISGPDGYGTGTFFRRDESEFGLAASIEGDTFGLFPDTNFVFLPENYVSGAPIFGVGTVAETGLGDVGATPGTYVWTLGSDPSNTVTLTVGPDTTPIPLPAGGALLLAGLGAIGAMRRRK